MECLREDLAEVETWGLECHAVQCLPMELLLPAETWSLLLHLRSWLHRVGRDIPVSRGWSSECFRSAASAHTLLVPCKCCRGTWAYGSVSRGRLWLYKANAKHKLASSLTQQVIQRRKLSSSFWEGKEELNCSNIRKTWLSLSPCKIDDFYYLGLLCVRFWAEQANNDWVSLGFKMEFLLHSVNRKW